MAYTLSTIRSGMSAAPEKFVDYTTVKTVATSGVLDAGSTDFKVTQKASPGMFVAISAGAAWIKKSDGSMVYPCDLDLTGGLLEPVITGNASGNPRIDAVVLYIDLGATSNTTATNVAKTLVVPGTAAASPVAPLDATIQAAVGASNPFIRLATVAVANGASSIVNANITDTRTTVAFHPSLAAAFDVGDVKASFRTSASGRFKMMNGDTIGNTGSTATHAGPEYEALFNYLVGTLGYTPTTTWALNGKVALPDARDRSLIGAGTTYTNGATGGSATHTHTTGSFTLTTAEMPSHTHTQNAHTHVQDAHTHTVPFQNGDQDGSSSNGTINGGATATSSVVATNQSTIATNQNTGGGGSHNHGNTGSTSNVGPWLAVYHYIKY